MEKYFKSWFARFEAVSSSRRLDPWLWAPAAALVMLGLLMVLNTTYFLGVEKTGDAFHYFKLQLLHAAIGLLMLLLLSQFSVRGLRRLALPLMIISAAMLLAVWMPGLGVVRGGARRWLKLGPVVIEPSELVKFATVFFLAQVLGKRHERVTSFLAGPLPAFLIVGPLALLILKQPDFGTTVMLAMVLFAMLFAAGAKPGHL
ncbi:MAG: FtsW/RodA/SpoVE family cell cycle protein, partial [Candidatus Binataceae bacterium]